MNGLSSLSSLPLTWQLTALSLGAAVVLACGLSLLAAWVLRYRSAPVRYGLLLSAVVLCLAAPGLSQLGRLSGVGQVRVTPPPALSTPPAAVTPVDAPQTFLPAELPQTVATPLPAPSKPRFVFSWGMVGGILMALWALGTLAGLARMALGATMVWMLIRSSRPADGAASRAAAERARQALGLCAAPRLRESPMTPMPLVVGLFRPVILLPSGLTERLDVEQLDAVLLHETAHIAHRDPLIGFAQRLAGALFWWCPLLHQVNRRLNELREYICDNYVIRAQGDGFRLARVLVEMAEQAQSGRWLRLAGAMAVTEPGGSRLEARVRRLVQGDGNTVTRMNLTAICGTAAFSLLVGCMMVGSAVRTGEEEKAGPADAPGIRVTRPSATEYTIATTMNMAKLTLLPGKWGNMTISSQDHLQWVFEAMVKPLDDEVVELSYRLSLAKTKGIREWQEHERHVPLGQWVKMQTESAAAKQAAVVLRVRPEGGLGQTKIELSEGKKQMLGTTVRILEVLQNNGPEKLAKDGGIEILWDPGDKGLPVAECTVYLEPYRGENWKEGLYSYRLVGQESIQGSKGGDGKAGRSEAMVLVPFLAKPPIIDGLLNAGEWDAVSTATASGTTTGASVRAVQPRIHLGYDKENLYVACYVPIIPAGSWLRADTKQSDVLEQLMRDDYVRVELWPSVEPSAGTKYGSFDLQWNAFGVLADWHSRPDGSADMKWPRPDSTTLRSVADGSGWSCELMIPLKSLRYGQYAATNAEGSAVLTVPPQDASIWRLRFTSKVGDASNDLAVATCFASDADALFRRASELLKEKQYAEAGALFELGQRTAPYHPMAPKALVLAAQCRMRGEDWRDAIRIFSGFDEAYPKRLEDWTRATHQPADQVARAYAEAEKVRPDVRYWLGDCHARLGDDVQAYRTWKKLTWEYPESPWVMYGHSRLEDKFRGFKGEDAAVEGTNVEPNMATKPDSSASTRDAAPAPVIRDDRTSAAKALPAGATDADALLRDARELQETADWAKRLNRAPLPLADLLAACRKVTERYPNTEASRKAMLDMADLQSKWGDKEQAVKSYQELAEKLANTPEGGIASKNVVDDCIGKKEFSKALAVIGKYVADPKAPGRDAMLMKGVLAAYSIEDYAKSRTLAEQLIKDHPESEYAKKASDVLPKIYSKLGLPADTPPPKPAPQKAPSEPAIGFHAPDTQSFAPPPRPTAAEDLAAAKDSLAKGDVLQAARRLDRIVNAKADPEIRAEALWRIAEVYRSCGNTEQAYRAYKILTWDYPESVWAKQARSRLDDKEFRDL